MEEGRQKNYHKALVMFIDILGSQNKMSFQELYEINNAFHSLFNENSKNDKEHIVYKRTIHTFSDCAYIIYDFKGNVPEEKKHLGKLFEVALCNCDHLFIQFLNKTFIFRGGVAYGDIYYEKDRSILFGPAVNKAYSLENNVAIYPRIVVDNFVAEELLNYWNNEIPQLDDIEIKTDSKSYYISSAEFKDIQGYNIKKDFDGMYMVHYLNSIETNVGNSAFIGKTNQEFVNSLIEFCDQQIIENSSNPHITQKYEWLLNYIYATVHNANWHLDLMDYLEEKE